MFTLSAVSCNFPITKWSLEYSFYCTVAPNITMSTCFLLHLFLRKGLFTPIKSGSKSEKKSENKKDKRITKIFRFLFRSVWTSLKAGSVYSIVLAIDIFWTPLLRTLVPFVTAWSVHLTLIPDTCDNVVRHWTSRLCQSQRNVSVMYVGADPSVIVTAQSVYSVQFLPHPCFNRLRRYSTRRSHRRAWGRWLLSPSHCPCCRGDAPRTRRSRPGPTPGSTPGCSGRSRSCTCGADCGPTHNCSPAK